MARYAPLVGGGDQLRISAGVLEEAPERMQFLLSEGVRMQGWHWRLEGTRARIEGPLRNPSAVWLYGTDHVPARFWMQPRATAAGTLNRANSKLFAEGQTLHYEAQTERLIVRGNALLEENGSALRGDRLVYDLKQEALRADGDGGVRLRLEPP